MNSRLDSLAKRASALAFLGFALHIASLFPEYHKGGDPLTECCLTFNVLQMMVWPAAGAALLGRRSRLLGACLLIGGAATLIPYMLTDLGTIAGMSEGQDPGAGLWISVGLNASLVAGSIVGLNLLREHPVPRFTAEAPNIVFAIGGALIGVLYAVGVALPTYKVEGVLGNVSVGLFDLEGADVAWGIVKMAVVVLLPLVGGFLRPLRLDGALLAGMAAILWSEVVTLGDDLDPGVSTDTGVSLRLAAAVMFTILSIVLSSIGQNESLEPIPSGESAVT